MFDSVQLVLFLVIIVLTVLLLVLGFQVYFILKDLRKTIVKANRVLDDASDIAEQVQVPLETISTLSSSLKAGSFIAILKLVKSFVGNDRSDERRLR